MIQTILTNPLLTAFIISFGITLVIKELNKIKKSSIRVNLFIK